ncbi:uncharacterized protein CLUP02_12366 [Colletotrichum lupini]|uniref:Uncharacterized protein n=1 Tax=Colletotrichum lupini TaxID=145971 RepID=A0A9Q8T081_9PEZI|nr:uncharacterized protein CLUP02_12366 [Colletotrichum lupini]UQC86864.1 hypothetical protein CLUP02_12366 [Colletotrichum lupini]
MTPNVSIYFESERAKYLCAIAEVSTYLRYLPGLEPSSNPSPKYKRSRRTDIPPSFLTSPSPVIHRFHISDCCSPCRLLHDPECLTAAGAKWKELPFCQRPSRSQSPAAHLACSSTIHRAPSRLIPPKPDTTPSLTPCLHVNPRLGLQHAVAQLSTGCHDELTLAGQPRPTTGRPRMISLTPHIRRLSGTAVHFAAAPLESYSRISTTISERNCTGALLLVDPEKRTHCRCHQISQRLPMTYWGSVLDAIASASFTADYLHSSIDAAVTQVIFAPGT